MNQSKRTRKYLLRVARGDVGRNSRKRICYVTLRGHFTQTLCLKCFCFHSSIRFKASPVTQTLIPYLPESRRSSSATGSIGATKLSPTVRHRGSFPFVSLVRMPFPLKRIAANNLDSFLLITFFLAFAFVTSYYVWIKGLKKS